MKKTILLPAICLIVLLTACNSSAEKETAQSIAQKWCDLNGKAYRAEEGPEKEKAVAARKEFEKEMDQKYKNDKTFMDEVEKEVEKCEDASEGRK
jgi:hypothetical protein